MFRATEVALGVAAGEHFAALPAAYREQLRELPATVAAREPRRRAASSQLAESVAALEGIRLDLLRLHAGANDLAPLTTLLDAARLLGEDIGRPADAQREVSAPTVRRPLGAGRIPTPE